MQKICVTPLTVFLPELQKLWTGSIQMTRGVSEDFRVPAPATSFSRKESISAPLNGECIKAQHHPEQENQKPLFCTENLNTSPWTSLHQGGATWTTEYLRPALISNASLQVWSGSTSYAYSERGWFYMGFLNVFLCFCVMSVIAEVVNCLSGSEAAGMVQSRPTGCVCVRISCPTCAHHALFALP